MGEKYPPRNQGGIILKKCLNSDKIAGGTFVNYLNYSVILLLSPKRANTHQEIKINFYDFD